MDLNKIQLNNTLVTQLYRTALVEISTSGANKTLVESGEVITFLGKNEKGIAILVNCDEAPYLPDAHLAFLIKMLSACNLTIADVAIVNICGNDKVQYEAILTQLNPLKILFFDVIPASVGFPMNFPQYKVQEYSSMKLISAPALGLIERDAEKKKSLWNALKNMFDIIK